MVYIYNIQKIYNMSLRVYLYTQINIVYIILYVIILKNNLKEERTSYPK